MRLDPVDWPSPVPISHRGSRLLWPENTMMAFAEAHALGFRHMETDLHITADGVLVCFHDDTLDRTTSGSGKVSQTTLEELRRLDAGHHHVFGGRFPFRGEGLIVPTLEELLTSYPDLRLVVDLKQDGLEGPLAKLIAELGVEDRLIVGSFHDTRLAEFRRLTRGTVPTSTGSREIIAALVAVRSGNPIVTDAVALQVPTHWWGVPIVDRRLVTAAHHAEMQIHVWTVNTVGEMNRLLDMGVDGLITDRPDLLRQALEQRGDWR